MNLNYTCFLSQIFPVMQFFPKQLCQFSGLISLLSAFVLFSPLNQLLGLFWIYLSFPSQWGVFLVYLFLKIFLSFLQTKWANVLYAYLLLSVFFQIFPVNSDNVLVSFFLYNRNNFEFSLAFKMQNCLIFFVFSSVSPVFRRFFFEEKGAIFKYSSQSKFSVVSETQIFLPRIGLLNTTEI